MAIGTGAGAASTTRSVSNGCIVACTSFSSLIMLASIGADCRFIFDKNRTSSLAFLLVLVVQINLLSSLLWPHSTKTVHLPAVVLASMVADAGPGMLCRCPARQCASPTSSAASGGHAAALHAARASRPIAAFVMCDPHAHLPSRCRDESSWPILMHACITPGLNECLDRCMYGNIHLIAAQADFYSLPRLSAPGRVWRRNARRGHRRPVVWRASSQAATAAATAAGPTAAGRGPWICRWQCCASHRHQGRCGISA